MSNEQEQQPIKQRRRRGQGGIYRQTKLINGERVPGPFWWISYHSGGTQHRESSGSTDPVVAEKLLTRRLAEAAGGKRIILPRAERLTLGEMLDDLETDYQTKGNRSTIDRARAHLANFFGESKKALTITRDEIQRFVAARKKHMLKNLDGSMRATSNATINRDLACLQRAFSVAVENKKLSHDHLPGKMPTLKEADPREGFLNQKDFETLRERLPEYLKLPVWFLFATGWRLRAMCSREWERDCELERDEYGSIIGGTIYLRRADSKNKRPWLLPITGELVDIMRAADAKRDPDCPFVFHRNGSKIGSFAKAWRRACSEIDAERKAKGLGHLLVHDLRRSRIRNLIRSGVSQTVAMRVSGHKTASVFQRYNITAHEDLEDALIKSQAYDAREAQKPERKPAQVIAISDKQRRSA